MLVSYSLVNDIQARKKFLNPVSSTTNYHSYTALLGI